MPVYGLEQVIDLEEGKITHKVRGISQLYINNLPVPEGIYLDHEEFEYYAANGKVSGEVLTAIKQLLDRIRGEGWLPFVSIRCESKHFSGSVRPPYSLLNVGIRTFDKKNYEKYNYRFDDVDLFHASLLENFNERAALLKYTGNRKSESADLVNEAQEVVFWLERMYGVLKEFTQIAAGFTCGILIQRMVFGCLDQKSGNGICCNFPGEITKNTRFRGVFIPYYQGVGISHGCWGPGEVDLAELCNINRHIYFELRGMFDYLEYLYGENRYIEFTVEGNRIYLLEHLTRQRKVAAGS